MTLFLLLSIEKNTILILKTQPIVSNRLACEGGATCAIFRQINSATSIILHYILQP